MRLLALALLMVAPLSAHATSPAAAQNVKAGALLVSSSPRGDASGKQPVAEVTLAFAQKVELFSVAISTPHGAEIPVYQTDYAPGTPKLTGKDFSFTLPAPLTTPGAYTISYLLKTKGIASLNGFIHFTIEPEFPAPRVVTITPAPEEEVSGPVSDFALKLDGPADLIMFDLQKVKINGDETAVTTIRSFIDDLTPDTAIRTGTSFAFALQEPLEEPGEYSVAYGYTTTNPDGSHTTVSDQANFTIR